MIEGYRRWFGRVAGTRPARSFIGPQIVARLDRVLYRRLHGSIVSLGSQAFPTLLLTTTGRKTGRRHTVPLFYLQRGDSIFVVASNYGLARHPAWSFNLLDRGTAHIEIDRTATTVSARLLSPAEKSGIWPDLLALFAAWERYEAETNRSIRVFELRPS